MDMLFSYRFRLVSTDWTEIFSDKNGLERTVPMLCVLHDEVCFCYSRCSVLASINLSAKNSTKEHEYSLLPLGVATVESAMVSTSVGSLRFRCWAIPRITRKPRPQICLTERLTARAVLLPSSGLSVLDTTGGTSHGWNVYEEDTDDDGDDDGENRLRMSSSGGARYLAACCCRRCCFL